MDPGPTFEVVDGEITGSWIRSAIPNGIGPRVNEQVPPLFDTYVRILHPALSHLDEEITWTRMARELGRAAHRRMTWEGLASDRGSIAGASARVAAPPATGEMWPPLLRIVAHLLAEYTATPGLCYFGLDTTHGDARGPDSQASLFWLGRQSFTILTGRVRDAPALGLWETGGMQWAIDTARNSASESPRFRLQAPNLMWPDDQSWFLATGYESNSTLLGGAHELLDACMRTPHLDAWRLEPTDAIRADVDPLN